MSLPNLASMVGRSLREQWLVAEIGPGILAASNGGTLVVGRP